MMLVFVCSLALAQEKQAPECPAIAISEPAGPPNPGEPWVFTSVIKGKIPSGLVYRWYAPRGSIVNGQGKPIVKVGWDPQNPSSVSVVLELIGLPDGCPNTASESIVVDYWQAILIDEFSVRLSKIEKERFKMRLMNKRTTQVINSTLSSTSTKTLRSLPCAKRSVD